MNIKGGKEEKKGKKWNGGQIKGKRGKIYEIQGKNDDKRGINTPKNTLKNLPAGFSP